jgi:hypothetical protein
MAADTSFGNHLVGYSCSQYRCLVRVDDRVVLRVDCSQRDRLSNAPICCWDCGSLVPLDLPQDDDHARCESCLDEHRERVERRLGDDAREMAWERGGR